MTNDHPYYFTWNHQPATSLFPVSHAEHDEFVLTDGRRIYDFVSTSFQTNFGHSHPDIRAAIHRQLDEMPVASPKASFALKDRVTETLLAYVGVPGGKIFYTVSGSESVENALKMARQVTGRTKVLARSKSYHGSSLGALSVTGDWRNEPHFTLDEHTIRIPEPKDDPDLKETRRIVNEVGPGTIAAVILETISGGNGVAIPSQAWFDAVQSMCHEHDLLLILDEVLCGFGRTGDHFAFQSYQLQPDFVCMSKGITSGYIPLGAVWTGPRIVKFYDDELLACGLTSYAHPLGLAALEVVLQLSTDESVLANKKQLAAILASALGDISAQDFVDEVRQRGLLAAIDLHEAAPAWDAFCTQGLHVFCRQKTVIVAPTYVSAPERLTVALETLQNVLHEHASQPTKG
jgi:taurine--2-oxoglutarate transaminase